MFERPLRVAHLADTHIGMENYGRLNPSSGLNWRLHDFLRSLDQALDEAMAKPVDLVVFAGDIYKTRDPTPTHQREFAQRVQRVVAAGIPVFIAAGNHDLPLAPGRASSVEIFRALEVPGVTVARTIGVHRLQTLHGPVQVVAFPWSVRSQVLAAAEYKNLTIAELNGKMIELTRAKLREQAETLDPALPTLLVGHAHVLGSLVGSERLLTMGTDPMYDLNSLTLPHVDYVAMGHIHKHQALAYGDPPIVYSGSIDRVDFGEEREEKGWVYLEVPEKGRAEWSFRKVHARPFVTIDARVVSENATEDVVKAIAREGERLQDAVVRLRIDLPAERLAELREDDIRAQLRGAFHLAPIERRVGRRTRDRWGPSAGSIQHAAPIDALAYYLEQRQTEPKRLDLLLQYARALMDAHDHEAATEPGSASAP